MKKEISISTIKTLPDNFEVNDGLVSEFCVFDTIKSIFPESRYEDRKFNLIIEKLFLFNIRFLPLLLTDEKNKNLFCILIFLNKEIINYAEERIHEFKNILKDNPYSIVITASDSSSKIIVSSLLTLKAEAILNTEDLYNPYTYRLLKERLKSSWDQMHIYQRPSISDILHDALNSTNSANFLKPEQSLSNQVVSSQHGGAITDPADQKHTDFIKMTEKYTRIYENTPYWYKLFGQIIKLLTGHKKISLLIKDKGLKENYSSTAEDMAHWYYIQYEVLPKWYKRIGSKLAYKKEKI